MTDDPTTEVTSALRETFRELRERVKSRHEDKDKPYGQNDLLQIRVLNELGNTILRNTKEDTDLRSRITLPLSLIPPDLRGEHGISCSSESISSCGDCGSASHLS